MEPSNHSVLSVPQEYGITPEEKLLIGQRICTPLMRKILADARYTDTEDCFTRLNSEYSKDVASPDRFVRTRLYFTSESHIHSLLTCLRYGGLSDPLKDEQVRGLAGCIQLCEHLYVLVGGTLISF